MAASFFLEGVLAGLAEAPDEVVLLNVGVAVLLQVINALGHSEAGDLGLTPQLLNEAPLLLQAFLELVHDGF